ncbi:MAG: hypothetical protein ABIY63_13300 [Fibrobacteria bacterium]
MAIDTAAKRRNVNRILHVTCVMGLSPSSGLDTADRVNAGRAYIGISYGAAPPNPDPPVTPPPVAMGGAGPRRKLGVGRR